MESWKRHLPDYEFMLWNFDKLDINSSIWVKQAFEAKKYAFAADYFRMYALYHYGGIYLDMDVEVIKPFDDLLHLPYFLGEEDTIYAIEAATMGAEKGCFWLKKCLEYYTDRKFILKSGEYDMEPLPGIMKNIFISNYTIKPINDITSIVYDEKEIYLLPVDFFSPKKWDDPTVFNKTENTYSIHHFAGSWKRDDTKIDLPKKKSKLPKFKKFIFNLLNINPK
jgi:mannosyltransferase OCH1-like enzyme